MRPGETPTSWPRRPFASTLGPHRFRRLSEARHSYHGRSVSHAPQPFLYLLFPYAIMPSPDACEQCVATLSRNEQKNARHEGAMARWRDGAMARWRDGRILRQSFGPVPFHEKMAEICGCERWFLRTWTKARILTWGYATRIGRPDRKRAQRPFTTANLCHFSVFGDTIFSSRMGIP